jgi:hypothetical protein
VHKYYLFILLMISFSPRVVFSEKLTEIHDAHIHYNQDMWRSLSVKDAVELLKEQNIQRVLVSATPTQGAEMFYRQAPEFVVPMLRPYASWRHRYFWFKDPELKSYLIKQLKIVPYKGIGEFHVFGKDADTLQIEQMISLAQQYKLVLHAHTDLEGMRILLNKAKGLVVIWAHGGEDVDESFLQLFLKKYPKFYIELSRREGMLDEDDDLTPYWKRLLIKYQKRFLLGTDTYKPRVWAELPEITEETRYWLKQLPNDVISNITKNNLTRLFPIPIINRGLPSISIKGISDK